MCCRATDRLKVCTRYRGAEGAEFDRFPYHQTVLHHASGEYEELAGWTEDLTECREESELPTAAREYLQYMSEFVGVPIALISVGPGTDQVISDRRQRRPVAGCGAGRLALPRTPAPGDSLGR